MSMSIVRLIIVFVCMLLVNFMAVTYTQGSFLGISGWSFAQNEKTVAIRKSIVLTVLLLITLFYIKNRMDENGIFIIPGIFMCMTLRIIESVVQGYRLYQKGYPERGIEIVVERYLKDAVAIPILIILANEIILLRCCSVGAQFLIR